MRTASTLLAFRAKLFTSDKILEFARAVLPEAGAFSSTAC